MATAKIPMWQITVTITRELEYPVEDGEDKDAFYEWAYSQVGKKMIQFDFIKHLNCLTSLYNAEMEIEGVELKEYEVKSTDTDPGV